MILVQSEERDSDEIGTRIKMTNKRMEDKFWKSFNFLKCDPDQKSKCKTSQYFPRHSFNFNDEVYYYEHGVYFVLFKTYDEAGSSFGF